MLNQKEITTIFVMVLILSVTLSLIETLEIFLYILTAIFFVLIVNVIAKKVTSFYLDSEIEVKLWEVRRYGFSPGKYFRRPFPAGAFFPIITTAFSFGYFNWMASLIFDVKPKIHRAAKRHGLYSFSEMTEYHLALIAASGVLMNLVFSVVGYLIGFPTFAKLNLYYAFFNLFPISDLDGNKIFFGSLILWSFLATIVLIGLGYVFFLV